MRRLILTGLLISILVMLAGTLQAQDTVSGDARWIWRDVDYSQNFTSHKSRHAFPVDGNSVFTVISERRDGDYYCSIYRMNDMGKVVRKVKVCSGWELLAGGHAIAGDNVLIFVALRKSVHVTSTPQNTYRAWHRFGYIILDKSGNLVKKFTNLWVRNFGLYSYQTPEFGKNTGWAYIGAANTGSNIEVVLISNITYPTDTPSRSNVYHIQTDLLGNVTQSRSLLKLGNAKIMKYGAKALAINGKGVFLLSEVVSLAGGGERSRLRTVSIDNSGPSMTFQDTVLVDLDAQWAISNYYLNQLGTEPILFHEQHRENPNLIASSYDYMIYKYYAFKLNELGQAVDGRHAVTGIDEFKVSLEFDPTSTVRETTTYISGLCYSSNAAVHLAQTGNFNGSIPESGGLAGGEESGTRISEQFYAKYTLDIATWTCTKLVDLTENRDDLEFIYPPRVFPFTARSGVEIRQFRGDPNYDYQFKFSPINW